MVEREKSYSREEYERAFLEGRINDVFEYFVRMYAPLGASRRFEADLFSLMRMVQQQATEPMQKQLAHLFSLMPIQSIFQQPPTRDPHPVAECPEPPRES